MNHYCKVCSKEYKSYQSLWNHNKKFHKPDVISGDTLVSKSIKNNDTFVILDKNENINHTLVCRYCNRNFNFRNNRWRHEKNCKTKEKLEQEREHEKKMEEKRLELEIKKEENERLRLNLKTNKSKKASIQNINKALQLRNANVHSNNNNTITNNNNNQQIVQNFQILQLGREGDVPLLLTNDEKSSIINSRRFALQKIVEILHGGNSHYKQFKNLIVTNLKNKYVYKYDNTKKEFVIASAEDMMRLLIDNRLNDLETIYDQYNHKISDLTKGALERFINEMNERDSDTRKYEIEQVKMLLFNDRDKIMSDLQDEISLVLTVNEV